MLQDEAAANRQNIPVNVFTLMRENLGTRRFQNETYRISGKKLHTACTAAHPHIT